MLKYIEMLARHQPELGSVVRKPGAAYRWRDYPECEFSSEDVDEARVSMLRAIQQAGEAQRRAKTAAERGRRPRDSS